MERRIVVGMVAVALSLTVAGCASVKQTTKTMVQQGIETTSTGQHNVVPANNAENAVNAINGSTQQSEQNGQPETGQ